MPPDLQRSACPDMAGEALSRQRCGAQAKAVRQRITDMAVTDRLGVAGMDLDFPACSRIAQLGKG